MNFAVCFNVHKHFPRFGTILSWQPGWKNIGILDAADSGRSTLREPIEFEMDVRPQSWVLGQNRSNEEYQNVGINY